MPRRTVGSVYRTGTGYGIRWPEAGRRPHRAGFATKTEARRWFSENVTPRLDRGEPGIARELTLGEFVELYLERHAATVRARTILELRKRLKYARAPFGDVPLRDLERMSGEIAGWRTRLPERSQYGVVQALRQTLEAGVRWGYLTRNPARLAGRNPQPPPRTVRVYTDEEVAAIAGELRPAYRSLPAFCAATGLRPEEWGVLERRDIDRASRVLTVRRTISSGEVVELAKTQRSLRQMPLSARACAAVEDIPPRLDTPYLFPALRGGPFDLANFRRREWRPAVEASGVAKPARIYDLRSTFASNALAAGISVFELGRIMGTSVAMIERHYGTLIEGAGADIARRLDVFEAGQGAAGGRSGVVVASDPD